jgi:8-oxo-dGTP diphosphatase
VPVLRSTSTLPAPVRTVAGVLRDLDAVAEVGRRHGYGVTGPARLLSVGDEVQVRTDGSPVRVRVLAADVAAFGWTSSALRHSVALAPTDGGTRLSHELTWTSDLDPERLLAAWSDEVARRVAGLVVAPVVVATALVRDGTVLAAQRTRPPALAGRWELPGGRVEAGESEAAAVVRECREELGTEVVPGQRLGTDLPIDAGVLRVHAARLAVGAPEPRALEHAALRWVDAAEVAGMEWVDADRAVMPELVDLVGASAPSSPRR